jgi:hypothetical protein
MPHCLQSNSSSSSDDEYSNEKELCIDSTQAAADGQEHTEFMPLAPVVGTDGASYESFEAYIAGLPAKNSHVVPDERFKRFVHFLRGDSTASDDPAQLKRDREKLFNTKELGPKALDGTRFPFGAWQLHQCVHMRTGEHMQRSKRENTYKRRKQAMVSSSECERVIRKVHVLGGHKGQERTWKHIAPAYHGIPQELVKVHVKNCPCIAARAGRSAKRKRTGTAMWAPSAWFRVEAELIDTTEQPTRTEGQTYQYILQIIDQKTLFTLLAPLQTKTAAEVSKHLYRWFAEHGVPQVSHTDNGGEFTGTVLVTELRGYFRSLRITTGAPRKPWVQG